MTCPAQIDAAPLGRLAGRSRIFQGRAAQASALRAKPLTAVRSSPAAKGLSALLVAGELRPRELLLSKLLPGDLRAVGLRARRPLAPRFLTTTLRAPVFIARKGRSLTKRLVTVLLVAKLLRVTLSVAVLCTSSSRMRFCERRMLVPRLGRRRDLRSG
jgi:hypothetical protein